MHVSCDVIIVSSEDSVTGSFALMHKVAWDIFKVPGEKIHQRFLCDGGAAANDRESHWNGGRCRSLLALWM
jgi:hypothetical protein